MKSLHLALANIKRGKSAAFSLFILIFIAALLLNIGLTILLRMNTFYDDKVQSLKDPHVSLIMSEKSDKRAYEEFLNSYKGVERAEKENIILLQAAQFKYGASELNSGLVLFNAKSDREIAPVTFVEKLDSSLPDDIYLPNIFKATGGYKLGDTFKFSYQSTEYSYRIAGFFEVTVFGTQNMGIFKMFLADTAYHQLSNQLDEQAHGIILSAIMTNSALASKVLNDFNDKFRQMDTDDYFDQFRGMNINDVKETSTLTTGIVSMILVAFAVVIVLVSLIVIKFRVTNSIDEGIVNIGILKAMGYKSREVIASFILQFLLIALTACLIGGAISYAVMPLFGTVVTVLTGLNWNGGFQAVVNGSSVLIINLLVLVVTYFATFRIRNLPPVDALRGGIHTHSFRRNYIPIEKSKGSLSFLLACKAMIANSKQNMMIVLIMVAITFASVFSIVLYYNIAMDKKAFVHMVGVETSNVVLQAKAGTNAYQLLEEMKQIAEVEKVTIVETIKTKVDGQMTYTDVSDDYSNLNNNTVYKGRYPIYDNEISISWLVSQQLHKGIGDTVEVEVGNAKYTYLITGLSQSLNNMGTVVSLTIPGIEHLIPSYEVTILNIYLEGIDNASFIKSIKAKYGDKIEEIVDIDENLESQTGVYASAVFAVTVVILATTILVVIMILYLVIKTMILKRKRDYGIMKAIGFTTFQLMNQIAMSFVPIVIAGVVIGGVLGYFYTNSLLSLLLSSAGIRNVQFVVPLPHTILLCVGIILFAYVVSLLVSRRIKKISAYSLITE